MKPRVLIAEDDDLVAPGMKRALTSDFEVVAVLRDGSKLVAEAARLLPDVAILETAMPFPNGIETVSRLRFAVPHMKLLLVVQRTDPRYPRIAFANGCMLKRSAAVEVRRAVHAVLAGRFYVSPALAKDLSSMSELHKREVLQLLAEGKTSPEVAHIIGISEKSVDFHKRAIMEALGFETVAELTRYAVERGLTR